MNGAHEKVIEWHQYLGISFQSFLIQLNNGDAFSSGNIQKNSKSPVKITTLGSWGFKRRFDIAQQDQMQNLYHYLGFGYQKRSIRFRHILCNTYTVPYCKEENTFVGWTQSSVKMSVGCKIWKEPVDKSIDHVPYCFAGACKVHCEREPQQATMVGNYGKLFVPLRHDDKVPFIIWTQIQGFLLY